MDYKEKVIALLNSEELSKEQKEKLEAIFPELKESEDERIKKTLIAFFRDWERTKSHCWNINVTDITAWLEKQGHMLNAAKVIEWINDQACQGWIEDVEVDKFIANFKKDFGL